MTASLLGNEEYYGKIGSSRRYTTVTDSLGRNYTNALYISTSYEGTEVLTYFLDGKYQYLEGDVACYSSGTLDGVMQIYADDVLVYTSETITATQEHRHFKVDIGNARFIKIKLTTGWGGSSYHRQLLPVQLIVHMSLLCEKNFTEKIQCYQMTLKKRFLMERISKHYVTENQKLSLV